MVVELLDRGVDVLQHRRGVRAFAQKHNAFHHVVIVLHYAIGSMDRLADLTKTNLRPLRDYRHVLDANRSAVLRFDDGLFDVVDVLDQPHSAHINLLRALFDEASAAVGIAVGELLLHLRQTQTVGNQLVGVDANLILRRDAAKGGVVHHIWDRRMYLLITQSCSDFSSIRS